MKILLCDDSITVRKKLLQSLKKIVDCEIFEAKNGQEAIEIYSTEKPDFVFMDIVMPFMDGIEALGQIIQIDEKAKVIMLSSVGTKENLQKALTLGAMDFVQKPWEEQSLSAIIQPYLKEVE